MKEITQETYLSTQLSKFNVTDAAIAEMSKKYMPLKIDGVEDKAGYLEVHKARMEIRANRIQVDKVRKDLVSDVVEYQRKVNAEAKRISGMLETIENHLESKEKAHEAEKARIKQEKEQAQQIKIQERINQLLSHGFFFSGMDNSSYILHLNAVHPDVAGNKITVDLLQLNNLGDEAFSGLMSRVKATCKIENDFIAEVKRREAEEAARLEAERAAETLRLQQVAKEQAAEKERLDAIAREQAEREAVIKAAEDKINAEKRAAEAKAAAEEAERVRQAELERARQEAAKQAIADAQAKAEQEELENKRQEELRPDKEKLLQFSEILKRQALPAVKSKEAEVILLKASEMFKKISGYIEIEAKKL